MDERCPRCDRKECADETMRSFYARGDDGSWNARVQRECAAHAVDWRARALAAETQAKRLATYALDPEWLLTHAATVLHYLADSSPDPARAVVLRRAAADVAVIVERVR